MFRADESRSPVPYGNADPLHVGGQAWPHPLLTPSPGSLTMPGSPLSAAEVFRTDLFCGPVETAMRKQKLKSLLFGRRARGTAWAAAPSAVEGVVSGLAQAWSQGRTLGSTSRGRALGNRRQEDTDAEEAMPLHPGKTAGWWGQGGSLLPCS